MLLAMISKRNVDGVWSFIWPNYFLCNVVWNLFQMHYRERLLGWWAFFKLNR